MYENNREDKIVLCREVFDLSKKNPQGYIVIGISQEYFQNLIQDIVHEETESVLLLGADGEELSRYGAVDEAVEQYLKSQEFVQMDDEERPDYFTYQDYEIICRQSGGAASIVCKIIPVYSFWKQIKDIAYMPFMLLLSMLAGLWPLLMVISNLVTKPLRQVSDAIRKVSTGDFEQKVPVYTHDEVGEVADCFNHMVEDI